MNEKEFAEKLMNDHYMKIMEFASDNDLSEEILITLLSKKHSIVTIEYLLMEDSSDKEMLLKVYNIIKEL